MRHLERSTAQHLPCAPANAGNGIHAESLVCAKRHTDRPTRDVTNTGPADQTRRLQRIHTDTPRVYHWAVVRFWSFGSFCLRRETALFPKSQKVRL